MNIALRTDSDVAQLSLIRAGVGIGIGICQVALARSSPGLARVLPDAFSLPLDTGITMHEDLCDSPLCGVIFDALVEALLAHVAAGVQGTPANW